MERERVTRIIGGRKRVVLGSVRYLVQRSPVAREIAKTRPFLLQSFSSTVEKIAHNTYQKHLSAPMLVMRFQEN